MIDDCYIEDETAFSRLAAFVEEVRPGFYQNAFPTERFFKVESEAVLASVMGADFDELAAELVEERQNLGFVRGQAERSQRK